MILEEKKMHVRLEVFIQHSKKPHIWICEILEMKEWDTVYLVLTNKSISFFKKLKWQIFNTWWEYITKCMLQTSSLFLALE